MTANILFVVIDQLRADCLTGALAEAAELPNLRALMDDGTTFERHYTVATPCGPSRASLLTGLYAMNHRSVRNGTPLDRNLPTVATAMRSAGYEPLLFGYTDTSTDPRDRHPDDPDLKSYEGLAAGFAEILRMRLEEKGSWHAHLKSRGYEIGRHAFDVYKAQGRPTGQAELISNPAIYRAEDSDSAFLTDRAIAELSVRSDRKWFAMISYIRPHHPLVAPAPYNFMYEPEAMPLPVRANGVEAHRKNHPYFDAYFSRPHSYDLFMGFDGHLDRLDNESVQRLRAVYLGLASEVDHHIGRLIAWLKNSGQYEDTLIVVTADHGEMLGDHFTWGKKTLFEPALHVPLVFRDPKAGGRAGERVSHFTESIDIAPTLLEWAGANIPPGFNGRSLLSHTSGRPPADWREHVFAEIDYGEPHKATIIQDALNLPFPKANFAVIRNADYKYVHFNGGLPPLLYDMNVDPGERNNLAGDPAYDPIILEMARFMIDHRMTHADHKLSKMALTEKGICSG